MAAPPESSVPRRIYVSHGPRDDRAALRSVRTALEQAGYVPLGEWSVPDIGDPQDFPHSLIATADGAVVLVDPAALQSATVANEAIELLGRRTERLQGDDPFPVVPVLSDLVSPAELRTGGLAELGDLPMAGAASFPDRVTETIALLDATFAGGPTSAAPDFPAPLSTIAVLDMGVRVTTVALGTVAGRPVLAAGGLDGVVRLWDLHRLGESPRVFERVAGRVRAVTIDRLVGADTLVMSGDDGMIWLRDAAADASVKGLNLNDGPVKALATGRFDGRDVLLAGTPLGVTMVLELESQPMVPYQKNERRQFEHPGFVNGIALDGSMMFTACADGKVRAWRLPGDEPVVLVENTTFTGHSDSVSSVATRGDAVFSGGYDDTVRRWDARTGQETHRFAARAGGVRSVTTAVLDGVSTVVVGGNDGVIRLWDPHTDASTTLAGHTGPVGTVASGSLDGRPIVVSGGHDGTVRIWGNPVADQVDWLSDAPSHRDLLHRKPLARAIATRLRKMNDEEPDTSFLVHIDGPWGAGKSTLLNFLGTELRDDFVTVPFDAWREAGVGPAWWALLTALRESVRTRHRWPARLWLRAAESAARLRRVGAPFFLALALLVTLVSGIWLFTPASLEGLQDTASTIAGVLASVGILWAGSLVAGRFLLWDSARGARLFEQNNTNPMLEVTRHFGWLLRRSSKPVVFLVDDLDRCPDSYVVELLDSVQTLVRDAGTPSAHVVVAADGAWIRTSYELHYATFAAAVAEPGRPLGYLFLDKFFQLRVPVPTIDATRQRQYLRELLRGPAAVARTTLAQEESRVRRQLDRSVTEAQVVETLRGTSDEVRDRVAGAALDKLTTPEAVAASEHSLQRFAVLLPPNPRTMKRFVNTYSAMRAVRTLEGNPVRVESLALWTIIEIRWPGLADHLRARPRDIGLVGDDEPRDLPATLRPLFTDPALRLLIGFDPAAPLDAGVIRSCLGAGNYGDQA
ncbi:P-loop NTPase fold protein [Actinophytocola sp.]|uniref:P-loop NTPase fold protein n=1 Tax=Actinophytocola sp. TaxID=1872138 RepID=UPI002D79E746|nr:P-loop NTPase fold protein [Actinophytocola sp.]